MSISSITQVNIQAIRAKLYVLCFNNYVTLLARKTQLSRATVSKFFNDQKIRSDNEEKIVEAALELILQKEEKQEHIEKLSQKLGLVSGASTSNDNATPKPL